MNDRPSTRHSGDQENPQNTFFPRQSARDKYLTAGAFFREISREEKAINQSAHYEDFAATVQGKLGEFLLLAGWFGLLTGLAEVSIRAVQKLFLGQPIHLSPHVVWMAPLADVVFFTLLGIVLFLTTRCWRTLSSPSVVFFVFSFFAFLGPLLWFPRLHSYAGALLAAGLATQAARFIVSHRRQFHHIVRRTMGLMAILVVVSALGVHLWQFRVERQTLANLPSAAPDAPNVLLIVLDTVRAQNLSVYGYPRPTTPHLEKLAKNGVVFEQAVSTSPWTLPSHASMFTGRFHHELSTDWQTPLDATYPTLAEVLSANGYMTAGFVANFFYCTYEWGLNRGFVRYEDYPISLGMIANSSWVMRFVTEKLRTISGNYQNLVHKTAAELNEDFLSWLSHKDSRPFFAFLNYMDAHEPYLPPSPLKFGSKRPQNPRLGVTKFSPQEIQELIDAYDGAIAYLDDRLGLLLAELEKRGVLNNTLLFITSDHGEEFGEHGVMGHGGSLYLPSLHVPLLIRFPRSVPSDTRVREPVTLRDIPATVLELVKLDHKTFLPGVSLTRHWKGVSERAGLPASLLLSQVNYEPNLPEWFPVSAGDMKSVALNGYHYIKNGDGREELYDMERDRPERNNLIDFDEHRRTIERFRNALERLTAREKGPR